MPAAKKESTIYMVCKAIGAVRKGGSKGVSRAAIANYLVANFGKTAGAHFNATLRQALAKGIKAGVLREGETAQRFKLGENAKSVFQVITSFNGTSAVVILRFLLQCGSYLYSTPIGTSLSVIFSLLFCS